MSLRLNYFETFLSDDILDDPYDSDADTDCIEDKLQKKYGDTAKNLLRVATKLENSNNGEKYFKVIKWYTENYTDIKEYTGYRDEIRNIANTRNIAANGHEFDYSNNSMADTHNIHNVSAGNQFYNSPDNQSYDPIDIFNKIDDNIIECINGLNNSQKCYFMVNYHKYDYSHGIKWHDLHNKVMQMIFDKYSGDYIIVVISLCKLRFTKRVTSAVNSKDIKKSVQQNIVAYNNIVNEFADRCCVAFEKYFIAEIQHMKDSDTDSASVSIGSVSYLGGVVLFPIFIKDYQPIIDKLRLWLDSDIYNRSRDFDNSVKLIIQFMTTNIYPKILSHMEKYESDGFKFSLDDTHDYNNIDNLLDNIRGGPVDIFKIIVKLETNDNNEDEICVQADGEYDRCPICLNSKKNMVSTCGHLYCADCIKLYPSCILCKAPITRIQKVFI